MTDHLPLLLAEMLHQTRHPKTDAGETSKPLLHLFGSADVVVEMYELMKTTMRKEKLPEMGVYFLLRRPYR